MRTLAKYVVFSGAAISLAWASVTVDVQGRTPYGHFLAAGGDAWVRDARHAVDGTWADAQDRWRQWRTDDEGEDAATAKPRRKRPTRRRSTTPERPATVQESAGAKRRVALLKAAGKQTQPKATSSKKGRTRVDAPMTKQDRAALDRLVAGR